MKDIIKDYEHFNTSFGNWDTPRGKYISSKKQYMEEMAKGNYKPYDGGGKHEEKRWKPSEGLQVALNELKNMGDKKGNINVATSGRMIEQMKKMGVNFNPKFMPTDLKGGIYASDK